MAALEYLKKPYSRVIVPESDGTFRGEILEFPGCISVGATAAEALARLEDVAASWLESMIARGQKVPEPMEENEYSGKLVLRMSRRLHRKAALAAQHDGVSLNTFITNNLAEAIGERARQPSAKSHFFPMASASFQLITGAGIGRTCLMPVQLEDSPEIRITGSNVIGGVPVVVWQEQEWRRA